MCSCATTRPLTDLIYWLALSFSERLVAGLVANTQFYICPHNIQCSIQSAFLRDSRTKNPNDSQNRKQGVKNDPLQFLWKSQFFGPHK